MNCACAGRLCESENRREHARNKYPSNTRGASIRLLRLPNPVHPLCLRRQHVSIWLSQISSLNASHCSLIPTFQCWASNPDKIEVRKRINKSFDPTTRVSGRNDQALVFI